MNFKKNLFVCIIICAVLTQYSHASSVFQAMATTINQQLFPVIQQQIIQPSDHHMQQLIHSIFAQLQNTNQTKDVANSIDVILSNLGQRQTHTPEIGASLVVTVMAHSLRLIAQKLYRSISFMRKSLLYWKKVDQESLFHYCITHIPTIWSKKFNDGFHIKQKIIQTEKVYNVYITQLGVVARLIHQLPRTLHDITSTITWINDALIVLKKYSKNQKSLIPAIKPFDAILVLKHIKTFLIDFEPYYNEQFRQIRNVIGLPSYMAYNFGKIILNVGILSGLIFGTYYHAEKIGTWYTNMYNNVKEYVYKPIYDNVRAIFSSQEKNLLMDEEKLKLHIKNLETLEISFKKKLELATPTEEDKKSLYHTLEKIFSPNKITEQQIQSIISHNDWNENLRQTSNLPVSMDNLTSTGKWFLNPKEIDEGMNNAKNQINATPITIKLLLYQIMPELYETLHALTGLGAEGAKAFHRLDNDLVSLRKLALLTPALLSIVGAYKFGSTAYQHATYRDYSSLKIALKELETVTICAIDTSDNNSNYGLFIFLLETLKLGVVQIVSSRYTGRNELLEDLKRLESPDITFKQRYKLIEQIRRSYSIFKQS